ncbi:MAG: zinc-dependent metalloprotease [Deltaproteobacteria bacterium]|nr:zinc-dependent metalloprotease [Deltaproteobacteria bacterium]
MRFGTPPNGRTRRLLSSLALGVAMAGTAVSTTSCVEDVGLVDRTSPYKLDKTMFEGVWMYTITTVDVPYSSAVSFSGETPFGTARKIIFDLQEDYLIAYPIVETVDGSEKEWKSHKIRKYWDPKNRDDFIDFYVGPPVARWPIESHFDVNRAYNTFNGAQSNEVVENTSDRPWYERDYIRVTWSRQGLQNFLYELQGGGADSYFVGEEKPGNPDELTVDAEGGYFDFVIRTIASSAAQSRCSIYDLSPYDCARAEVKVRHAFRRYDPKRDYEPIRYQNEVYQDRFGFFATERYAYDYDWGPTYRGKIEFGNRWNLWRSTYEFVKPVDDAGNEQTIACFKDKDCDRDAGQRCQKDTSWFAEGYCATPVARPYKERGLRPIIYHLSADWHPDYLGAAYRSADGWSDVFKDAVAWLLMWEEKGVAAPRGCETHADCKTPDVLLDETLTINDSGITCHADADCSESCGADGYCQARRACDQNRPCASGQSCSAGFCEEGGSPVVSKIKVTALRGNTIAIGNNGAKGVTHDNFSQRVRSALPSGHAYVRFLNLDTTSAASLSANGVAIAGGAYDAARDLDPADPATADFMAAVPVGSGAEFIVSKGGTTAATTTSNVVANAHYLAVWNGTDVFVFGSTFNQSQQGVRAVNAVAGGPPLDLAVEGAKLAEALPYGAASQYVFSAGAQQRATLSNTGARGDFTCYKDETVGYCSGWGPQVTDADRDRARQLKSELPDMFVLCENRFDPIAAEETVTAEDKPTTYSDARYSVNQGDKVYNPCGDATLVPHPTKPKKQGDSRYSYFYWVNEPQRAGPLGYGPSEADPESGQIMTATANIYGGAVHTYGQYAQDIIDLVNGDLDIDQVVTGEWIRQYLDTRVEPDLGRVEGGLGSASHGHDHEGAAMDPRATDLHPEAVDAALDRHTKAGLQPPARWHRETDFPELMQFMRDPQKYHAALDASLPKIDPKLYHDRLNKVAGTWIEDLLINDEVKLATQFVDPDGTMGSTDLRKALSPTTWSTKHAMLREHERMTKLGERDCIMLGEFADDAVVGIALEMKNKAQELAQSGMSPEDVRRWVRLEVSNRILQGVLEHEVGHTIGLRHNFSGSTDVFNFFDRYYEVREKELILCQDDAWCDDILEACAFRGCTADADCPAGTACASVPNENGTNAFQCAAPNVDDPSRFTRTGTCSEVIAEAAPCTKDSQCGASGSGNVCYIGRCYAPRAQFAPRPFMTDFEKANKRTEYQYTTVMDYGGRFNSDVHSMGKYDYAAIKFGYAQLIDTYSDPSRVESKIEAYTERFGGSPSQWSFLKNSRSWPTRGTGFYHPFNYLTNYIGVEENLKRTPVPFHILRYQQDMTANDVREILDWEYLEVPYAYCSDEYRGNMGCYYFDQGIDMGEMAQGATDQLEEYYIFDAFKRERLTYGAYGNPLGYYMRLMDRYFRVLGDVGMYYALYDNFLFRYSWYNEWKKAPLGGRTMEQAAIKAFSTLKDAIASPAPGSYELDPETGYYTNVSLKGGVEGADLEIPFGVGRFPFTQFGADLGYYYYQHPLWFGSFWEKLGALVTLTDSTAYFVDTYVGEQINIGVGTSLGYNTVFANELNNFLGGVIAGDLDFYAGRAIGNRYVPPSISGTNAADKPVEPALNNFTMKLYAALYGLAFIPAGFDPQFIDRLAVFLEGEATQFSDDQLAQLQEVRFEDPVGGKVYVAYSTNYGDFGEPKIDVSAELVLKAQDLADDWAAESDPVQKAKLQKQMGDVREVLDVLRQLNHVYGSSTLGL